jgi:hypothetical protein
MRNILHRAVCLLVVVPLGLTAACGGRPGAAPQAVPEAPVPVVPQAETSAPPSPMPKNPAPRKATPKPTTGAPHHVPADRLVRAAAVVEPGTTLGVVVYDRVTGTTPLEYNANRSFRSASLVKLLIAIDVLDRGASVAQRGQLSRMLEMSDDSIASALWVRDGGPDIVRRTSAELGLSGVRPPEEYGRWGEAVVTPKDVVAVYRYVLGLPRADRTLIVGALGQAPRIAADGFDQHFGIPDGLHAQWAVKQGWGSNRSAKVVHSTGLVGPGFRYVVVLLTEHPPGTDWQTCARSVTATATALHDTLPAI